MKINWFSALLITYSIATSILLFQQNEEHFEAIEICVDALEIREAGYKNLRLPIDTLRSGEFVVVRHDSINIIYTIEEYKQIQPLIDEFKNLLCHEQQ